MVFERLFSLRGLLRKLQTSILLATYAVKILPFADYIIVLGSNGTIIEQGSFPELNSSDGYVSNLDLHANEAQASDEDKIELILEHKKNFDLSVAASTSERNRQIGDMSIYKYYLSAAGRRTWHCFS